MHFASGVSKAEYDLVFRLTLLGFLLRIVELVKEICFADPPNGKSFGMYSIFEMEDKMSPIYSFVVFLLCTILAWKLVKSTSLFSIFLLSALAVFFDRWLIGTRIWISRLSEANNYDYAFKTFDFALIDGSVFDVITLVLVNVLLIWQISIFFRFLLSGRPAARRPA